MADVTHPLMAQLRAERLRRGWTLDNIARRLGTGKSTIWNWERRHQSPRLDHLAAYADALGLELALVPTTPHHTATTLERTPQQ